MNTLQPDGHASHEFANRHMVAGVFHDHAAAERAIKDLMAMGFASGDIGLAMRDRDEHGQLIDYTGHEKDHDEHVQHYHPHTGTGHAGEGAVVGALGGGVLGGLLALFAGAAALAVPGVGPIIVGGAIAAAIGTSGSAAALGVGLGATAGSLIGTLVGLGIPEEEAHDMHTGFYEGGAIVTVRTGGHRDDEVMDMLRRHGANAEPVTPSLEGTMSHPLTADAGFSEGHV